MHRLLNIMMSFLKIYYIYIKKHWKSQKLLNKIWTVLKIN